MLTVVEADALSGWLWCGQADGVHGWVPVTRTDAHGMSELAAAGVT